jgi:hypothetical protein
MTPLSNSSKEIQRKEMPDKGTWKSCKVRVLKRGGGKVFAILCCN